MAYMFQAGDVVKYSRKFLQSIGALTGPMPNLTGEVQSTLPCGDLLLADVKWADGTQHKVNVKNLVLKSRTHLEPV